MSAATLIWIFGILAWTIIRIPHRRRAKKTAVVTHRRSTPEQIALGLCIAGLVVVPAFWIATGLPASLDRPQPVWATIAGTAALVIFLWLFHRSHKDLARNWSVTLELRKDHKLVDTGVYSRIRHPMYTSFWLWGLSQALLIANWAAGLAGLAAVAWLYFSRIDKEEAMMREHFGDDYDAYVARTRRLVPSIKQPKN